MNILDKPKGQTPTSPRQIISPNTSIVRIPVLLFVAANAAPLSLHSAWLRLLNFKKPQFLTKSLFSLTIACGWKM